MGREVSIIIPNWNGEEVLTECICSILHHTRNNDFEIIIIDNGSTDASSEIIRLLAASDDRIKTIFNAENLYFARACNQGYEISRGRYVVVANNDIVLKNDAIRALVTYADEHPEVGAVTPRFCDRAGTPQEFYRRLPNALFVIAHYHRLGRAVDRLLLGRRIQHTYLLRDKNFEHVEVVDQPGASFTLLRRQAIDATGMFFDERFPLLFNDVDLFLRLKKAGFESHVLPGTRVVHLEGVSSKKLEQLSYENLQFRGIFEFFKKHHPLQYPVLCCVWPIRWIRFLRRTAHVPCPPRDNLRRFDP